MAEHSHGHTPAAWTGVIIAFLGFSVAGAFVIAAKPAGFWAGMALVLLGPIVGGVMRTMGLGSHNEPLARTPATTRSAEEESRAHVGA
ncbi:HGxxPAAW family protein [Actinacidiphila acididurans]|uniref:HGxxPAAW family protein n=1 Tax=Actinacidiphila acididurans TaxID=2784346 RepID=UPI001F1F62A9|nr:HGxxPAAW family protein [Actinacidiphila acididurans]